MLNPIRVPILILTGLALAFPYTAVQAQRSTPDLIVQAFQQWSGGEPKAAIAILEPMLQAGVNGAERVGGERIRGDPSSFGSERGSDAA